MTSTRNAILHRTVSRDGTQIGYFTTGEGPPLVLVHGGLGDHSRWNALRPYLEPHVTVHAMDRRGRGASGDSIDWSLEREYEDVAAVVDAVAEASGEPVNVYGVSLGGLCALNAATRTRNLGSLALYEGWPPVPPSFRPPAGFVEEAEEMLARDDREGLLKAAYSKLLQLGDEDIVLLERQPEWSARLAAAHTIPRELRAAVEVEFDPDHVARVEVPTLLLVGEDSPAWDVEAMTATLPDAEVAILEGQGHTADLFAPQVVAEPLLDFLDRQS
jgi:pimeloyl-ACP methyl ester carboxylesterase